MEKEKDIFKEIGDQLKEIGEDLKTELEKGEKKIKGFEQAIQPSLSDLGEKLKELGKVLSPPTEDFSRRFKDWKDSVKPVVKDMGDRAKEWKNKEKEQRESEKKSERLDGPEQSHERGNGLAMGRRLGLRFRSGHSESRSLEKTR